MVPVYAHFRAISSYAALQGNTSMAKQSFKGTGITIRIGAAHDQVEVRRTGLDGQGRPHTNPVIFDRSKMRKDGKPELQGALRRQVVDVWEKLNSDRKDGKQSRAQRIAGQQRDKARRERA